MSSCATPVGGGAEASKRGDVLVMARVVTVLLERPGRIYDPALIFFEVKNGTTGERFRVDVEDADKVVTFHVPPGPYQVTRVQIGEGPFRSMANVELAFQVEDGRPTYLGTLRFGVESPRYGRKVMISSVNEQSAQDKDLVAVVADYPEIDARDVEVSAVAPDQVEARLYEVPPYPRYQRYFRRHQW